jgi:hypothetical protein
MKNFFDIYLAMPLGILVFLFIIPTVASGGFAFAGHVFGFLPDSGLCQKSAEVKK